jgi:hypothetical protein
MKEAQAAAQLAAVAPQTTKPNNPAVYPIGRAISCMARYRRSA